MKTRYFAALALGAVLWAATPDAQVFGDDGQAVNPTKAKRYVAKEKIRVDARTGKLRLPTREETDELVATLKRLANRSSAGLRVETGRNGAELLHLRGRFGSVLLSKPNADGTRQTRCVGSLDEAAAFLGLVATDEADGALPLNSAR